MSLETCLQIGIANGLRTLEECVNYVGKDVTMEAILFLKNTNFKICTDAKRVLCFLQNDCVV